MSPELFFVYCILIMPASVVLTFMSFHKRRVMPIVMVALVLLSSGIGGIANVLLKDPGPRFDPALEAYGIQMELVKEPTPFLDILGIMFSVAMIVSSAYAMRIAFSRAERNRTREELRNYYNQTRA